MDDTVRLWFYKIFYVAFYSEQSKLNYISFVGDNLFKFCISEKNSDTRRLSEWLDSVPYMKPTEWLNQENERRYLFAGSGEVKAAPWGSVYQNSDASLNDEHTLAVRRLYQGTNFKVADLGRGPEDHIGLEMLFMAKIIEQEDLLSCADSLELQKEMLAKHLSAFLGEFEERVEKSARIDFYRDITSFALDFIRYEKNRLCTN